jgi:hypothetical protein
MYVIKRTSDGKYVAPGGQQSSYTPLLQRARTFDTREQAEGERCEGNEIVVPVAGELHRGVR